MTDSIMNQADMVLDYIRENGSITAKEAENDLGIMRLASRIHELRKDGYPIIGTWRDGSNRFGIKTRFMRYSMGKAEQ